MWLPWKPFGQEIMKFVIDWLSSALIVRICDLEYVCCMYVVSCLLVNSIERNEVGYYFIVDGS